MEYSKFVRLKYLLVSYGCGESYATHATNYLIGFAKRNNMKLIFVFALAKSLNNRLDADVRNILTYITRVEKHFETSLLTANMLFHGLFEQIPEDGMVSFYEIMNKLKCLADKGLLKE